MTAVAATIAPRAGAARLSRSRDALPGDRGLMWFGLRLGDGGPALALLALRLRDGHRAAVAGLAWDRAVARRRRLVCHVGPGSGPYRRELLGRRGLTRHETARRAAPGGRAGRELLRRFGIVGDTRSVRASDR